MREVEVKFRVRDTEALLVALKSSEVELGPPVRQDDQAYAPAGWSYGASKLGVPFTRLRTITDQHGVVIHTFTVKRPAENAMSCDEHESRVADRGQMHGAVLAMGFCPTVRIVKTRRVGVLGDLQVCVDDVDHVGSFLELERVVPSGVSGEVVQAGLVAFVDGLGVAVERVEETYDSLVHAAMSAR